MKELFDKVSLKSSKLITKSYSTSFSLGIHFLNEKFHNPIYAIYGFVRLGDEIVDTFHDYDKNKLFNRFVDDVNQALEDRISMNPVLNSFQHVYHKYNMDRELVDLFLQSMEMDLQKKKYDVKGYKQYILGSAEVVGLMCLRVFCEGDRELYTKLKPYAMSLGSAFQKINFLRDLNADFNHLGRTYFPNVNLKSFNKMVKRQIEEDIEADFQHGLEGIRQLPQKARFGVYMAYIYFHGLFNKIRKTAPSKVLKKRIRISNPRKYFLFFNSYLKFKFNLI
jgi:phytoene/squalene synthetase